MDETDAPKTSLILSGGGARAAYQVGVLSAIADLLPNSAHNPFDIICGTSAGAINATALATHAVHYRTGVRGLQRIWGNLTAEQIYRTDIGSLLHSVYWLLVASFHSGYSNHPVSLLDNTPLRKLLSMVINFRKISRAIDNGDLQGISITCSGYGSGESVSFFQGNDAIQGWRRSRRVGVRTELNLDHLMASSAIPGVFPAVRINREYFGDGAMRQLAPLSPALHMGADKILVIGVSGNPDHAHHRATMENYPSVAQIIGHLWNSSFLDAFEGDVERLERVNNTLRLIPPEKRAEAGLPLREVEVLKINPSQQLDEIAALHVDDLPRTIRLFFRGSGATKRGGSSVLSYILFEKPFCKALMDLGYRDAMDREADIRHFFREKFHSTPS